MDTEHTVLSYIPNTAEVAFYGLVHGFKEQIDKKKVEQIAALGSKASSEEVYRIIHQDVRSEKVAWKDIKLRTFITEGNSRNDLASHVYDVTYECIKPYEDKGTLHRQDKVINGGKIQNQIKDWEMIDGEKLCVNVQPNFGSYDSKKMLF